MKIRFPLSVHSQPTIQRLNDNTSSMLSSWPTVATSQHWLARSCGPQSQCHRQCQPRSLRPSRSSHSWNLYSVATSWLLLLSLLSYQPLYHSQTLLCRPPHHVKSLRILPPKRRTNLSPRYLLTWQCRRFSTVYVPHPWKLPCRRSHTVLVPRTFLRSLVLAQLPRFELIRQCRLLSAVWCNMMLPHNYCSRRSLLAAFNRTALWIAKTLFVSPRHQCRVQMFYLSHRLDSHSQSLSLSLLLTLTCSLHMARLQTALPAILSSRLSVPHMWEHTLHAQPPAPRRVQVRLSREPTTLLAPLFVQTQDSSPNQRQ